jgi:hypothetical protein
MNRETKDFAVLSALIAAFGFGMVLLGMVYQEHQIERQNKAQESVIFTLSDDDEGMPSEGDLMRVQYIDGDRVYMCVID